MVLTRCIHSRQTGPKRRLGILVACATHATDQRIADHNLRHHLRPEDADAGPVSTAAESGRSCTERGGGPGTEIKRREATADCLAKSVEMPSPPDIWGLTHYLLRDLRRVGTRRCLAHQRATPMRRGLPLLFMGGFLIQPLPRSKSSRLKCLTLKCRHYASFVDAQDLRRSTSPGRTFASL